MKKLILSTLFLGIHMIHAQTQIIAHRGFFQSDPPTTENSIQALKNAQKLHIYGSEFDVRMSKDGVLVINHDEHHGKMIVAETNFNILKKIRLENGEKLPTLEKYLKQGKKNTELKLVVELKPATTSALENEMVQKAIQLIKKLHLESQCEFISFSFNICKEVKRQNPNLKVQYLNGDLNSMQIKNEGLDGIDYHYSVFRKNPTWITEANSLGLITNAWTVNDEEIFQELKSQNIQFVTSNRPDILKSK